MPEHIAEMIGRIITKWRERNAHKQEILYYEPIIDIDDCAMRIFTNLSIPEKGVDSWVLPGVVDCNYAD